MEGAASRASSFHAGELSTHHMLPSLLPPGQEGASSDARSSFLVRGSMTLDGMNTQLSPARRREPQVIFLKPDLRANRPETPCDGVSACIDDRRRQDQSGGFRQTTAARDGASGLDGLNIRWPVRTHATTSQVGLPVSKGQGAPAGSTKEVIYLTPFSFLFSVRPLQSRRAGRQERGCRSSGSSQRETPTAEPSCYFTPKSCLPAGGKCRGSELRRPISAAATLRTNGREIRAGLGHMRRVDQEHVAGRKLVEQRERRVLDRHLHEGVPVALLDL
jgi:hypothetical protein